MASNLASKLVVLKGFSIALPKAGALNNTPLINAPPTKASVAPSNKFTFSFPNINLSAHLSPMPANTSVPPSSNGSYKPLLRDLTLNTLSFKYFPKPPLTLFVAFIPSLTLFN